MNKSNLHSIIAKLLSFFISCFLISCLLPVLSEICNTYSYIHIDNHVGNFLKEEIFNYLIIDKENSILLLIVILLLFFISYFVSKKILTKYISNTPIERIEIKVSRFDSVNVTKALGVLLVIIAHTCFEVGFYERSVNEPVMWPLIYVYSILLTCVPLFICMTGFLMINKTVTLKHYIGWFKYYIPYVLIMLMSYIYCVVVYKSTAGLFGIFTVYLNGYMSMFFGLYLLIPFLNILWANLNGNKKVVLLVGLLFLTIIPSVTGMMFTRWWTPLCPILYYYTGAFLREYKVKIKNIHAFVALFTICLLETLYAVFYSDGVINMGYFWNEYNNYCNTYFILPTYFLTVLIIILIINKNSFSSVTIKLSEKLSYHSLEMYLISSALVQGILWAALKSRIELTANKALLISPIVVLVEIIITFIISVIIKSISTYLYNLLVKKMQLK